MEKTRHFVVDTPVGQLAIYAKHDKTDCAADYVKNYSGHNLALKAGATKLLETVGQMAS